MSDQPHPETERIADYLAGELGAAERRVFEAELAGCEPLRQLVAELESTRELLAQLPAGEPVRDLAPEILERITRRPGRRAGIPFPAGVFRSGLARVAAAVLIALLGVTAIRRLSPPDPAKLVRDRPAESRQKAWQLALDWLKQSQEPNGGWDSRKWGGRGEFDVALSGLALLVLVEETPETGELTPAARKAVEYLRRSQNPDGAFGPNGEGRMYNHGITTVALLRAERQGPNPEVDKNIDAALAYICRTQTREGGWGYTRRAGLPPNTSVSAWQLRALALGRESGRGYPNHNLQRGLLWLSGLMDDQGSFGYRKAGDAPTGGATLTAMGAYCVYTAGFTAALAEDADARLRSALAAAAARSRVRDDFYRDYFLASAMEAAGGPGLNESLGTLRNGLAEQAFREADDRRGSWEPADRWGSAGGRIYSTSMAALSLHRGSRPM